MMRTFIPDGCGNPISDEDSNDYWQLSAAQSVPRRERENGAGGGGGGGGYAKRRTHH